MRKKEIDDGARLPSDLLACLLCEALEGEGAYVSAAASIKWRNTMIDGYVNLSSVAEEFLDLVAKHKQN